MRDVRLPAILLGLAAVSAGSLATGCVAVGSDKSGGFQETAAGFAASFPTPARLTYVDDEVAVRTLTFTHDGDRVACSHDGGATYGGCDGPGTLIWRAADYAREHVIKVGKSKAETHIYRFTPSEKLPGLTFVHCDQTVAADEDFTAFLTRIVGGQGGSALAPKVICFEDGVTVQAGVGQSRMQFSDDHFIFIAREGATAWLKNGESTGSELGESIFDGNSRKDLKFVGLNLATNQPSGQIISNVADRLYFDSCTISTDNYADDAFKDIWSLGDVTVRKSTLSLGGGSIHGLNVFASDSTIVVAGSGFGVVIDGDSGESVLSNLDISGGPTAIGISSINELITISHVTATSVGVPVLNLIDAGNTVNVTDSTLVAGSVSVEGVHLSDGNTVTFDRTYLSVSLGYGIYVLGGTLSVIDSTIGSAVGTGIRVDNASVVLNVTRSSITSESNPIISVATTATVTVADSQLYAKTSGLGIEVDAGGVLSLTGTSLTVDAGSGIILVAGGTVNITSSTVLDNSGAAIEIDAGGTVNIISSQVEAHGSNGVYQSSNSKVNVFANSWVHAYGATALENDAGGEVNVDKSRITGDRGIYATGSGGAVSITSSVIEDAGGSGGLMLGTDIQAVVEGTVFKRLASGYAVGLGVAVQVGATGPDADIIDSVFNQNSFCDVDASTHSWAGAYAAFGTQSGTFDYTHQLNAGAVSSGCPP